MTDHVLDMDAYRTRIGWRPGRESTEPSWANLRNIHLAHRETIPFENAEVILGSVPSLDIADVEAKLVHAGRGGYCFEQNSLLAAVLERLGYGVTRLAARTRSGAAPGDVRPRTHMTLLVTVPGTDVPYVCDVGFGGTGPIEPLPLTADATSPQGGWRFRLTLEETPFSPVWVMESRTANGDEAPDAWEQLYAFTLEPQERVDFDLANWWIATSPRSPFTQHLFVQRAGLRTRLSLVDRTLAETGADGSVRERMLADDREVLRVLAADFGIVLPCDTQLPSPRTPDRIQEDSTCAR